MHHLEDPIALHPEDVPGSPQEIRWVSAHQCVPFTGPVARAPEELQALLDRHVIDRLSFDVDALRVTLEHSERWRDWGETIRAAIASSLTRPEHFTPIDPSQQNPDLALAAGVQEIIDGPLGDYIRSHNGGIEVLEVQDGAVTIQMKGACRSCPAFEVTVRQKIEATLRERCPQLRELTCLTPAPSPQGSWLPVMFRRT